MRRRVDPLRDGRDERHDLERRAGLALGVGGDVELRVLVARGRGHREDVAVGRVDRHDRRRRRAGEAEVLRDRRARLALEVEVDRRLDRQAAAADGLDAVALDELVGDVVEEVALAPLAEVAVALQPQRLADRGAGGRVADEADVGHLAQDRVAARRRGPRLAERVVLAGRLRQAGEQRRLRQREL